jgi:hypothetical protein
MINVSNDEFIKAIFGEDAPWCHITDFVHDPSDIPDREHLRAWRGDYYSRYQLKPQTNQYFTVSTFYADEKGVARRRKALYRQTHCVVLDDVKEKLSMTEVEKLPRPSWILETSPGSEQWGYILTTPETNSHRIDNLHDGLISGGLAPNGKDPGQKGTTRYVRLPEGVNSKKVKMIDGQPWQCRMTLWEPFSTTTLEQLAKPFNVDLDSLRREARVDGAAEVNDHPLLELHDIIKIKEVRSDGRFDCTCPWVTEHTDNADSGSAIFTNGDGTLGFKCHHGACQERTGRSLLNLIEEEQPGFGVKLAKWQAIRAFQQIAGEHVDKPSPNIERVQPTQNTNVPLTPVEPASTEEPGYQSLIDMLHKESPFSDRSRALATQILKSIDSLPAIDKLHMHEQVRDIMRWSKPEFKTILDDLRQTWYTDSKEDISFFDEVVYIAEQNQFFDRKKRIFFTAEAYQNTYAHLDPEVRKEALQGGRVTKVDRIDYAPKKPPVFEEDGILYGNSWFNGSEPAGVEGDVSRWIDHFKVLGWEKEMDHMIKWMAFTIRHPDIKINHMLILGSGEGGGKDWLLYPLMKAMGENHMTIDGEELLSSFDDYKLASKHLHINEVELGDHREATKVSNKLKPLATAPPFRLRVNQKGIKPIRVRNILSVSMTTNSQRPVHLNGTSRRIFAAWSNLNIRDEQDNVMPEWQAYWADRWEWMHGDGASACIWYLKNVVDLTNFNPGAAPPMTDFLRDMAESSKSPLQQTLEAFIREKIDIVKCDIITSDQINLAIRHNESVAAGFIYVDKKYISPSRIDLTFKSMATMRQVRCEHGRAWVIRNHSTYLNMSDAQVYDEHLIQVQLHKSSTIMTAV